MRTVSHGTMQGTRVGSGPASDPYGRGFHRRQSRGALSLRERAPDDGAVGHLDRDAAPAVGMPGLLAARRDQPARPAPPSREAHGEKTHLGQVKSRRSPAEGAALMAESLARRDHPEGFNVSAGPQRRKA